MVCQWCLRVDETWYKNILLGMCVIQAHVRKFMKYRKNAKTINTGLILFLSVLHFSISVPFIFKLHTCIYVFKNFRLNLLSSYPHPKV